MSSSSVHILHVGDLIRLAYNKSRNLFYKGDLMVIKSINSKQDLESALKRVDELWDVAKPNTSEGDELVTLEQLIEDYELVNIVAQRIAQEEIEVDIDDL